MTIRGRRLGAAGAVLLAVASLAAAGCQQKDLTVYPEPRCDFNPVVDAAAPVGPVLVPQIPGSITPMALNTVNVTDIAISNKVLVQSTNARRLESGDVEAFARIVNCTDFPLQLEARTHFLDAGQGAAEPVTAWSRLFMTAHGIADYSAMSVAGGAVETYLIELREGR